MFIFKFASCIFSKNFYVSMCHFNVSLSSRLWCSAANKKILFARYSDVSKFGYHKQSISTIPRNLHHISGVFKSRLNANAGLNLCIKYFNIQYHRYFHTSQKREVHPIVWIVLKPVFKLAAVLSGRGFRKWWKNLPKNKKKYFLNVLKENRRKMGIGATALLLLSFIYYVTHLEETPVTNRRRFMAFNAYQLEKINDYELQQIMTRVQDDILPADHPATRKVQNVVNRILLANSDLQEVKRKKWGVAVVDSSIENAFVLPIGYVFVFSGMLRLCTNDDQLGIILSHEIAHCILNHGAENVSFAHLLDIVSILIIAAIWAVLPSDSISLLIHWLYQKSVEIFLQLPYNRKIETEADFVGLRLAAKACFDVRESSAFWAKMAVLKRTVGMPEVEFLSTHPSHEKRSEYLDSIMDQALKIRADHGCPSLRKQDPRNDIEAIMKSLEIARAKYFKEHPKCDFRI